VLRLLQQEKECDRPVWSVGVSWPDELNAGLGQNSEVQQEAPIIDVPKIELDSPVHRREIGRFAAVALDLSPPGNSRFDVMAKRIVIDRI